MQLRWVDPVSYLGVRSFVEPESWADFARNLVIGLARQLWLPVEYLLLELWLVGGEYSLVPSLLGPNSVVVNWLVKKLALKKLVLKKLVLKKQVPSLQVRCLDCPGLTEASELEFASPCSYYSASLG